MKLSTNGIFILGNELISVYVSYCPLWDNIRTLQLYVIGPILLTANGKSPLEPAIEADGLGAEESEFYPC